jgi:hypothetical protein
MRQVRQPAQILVQPALNAIQRLLQRLQALGLVLDLRHQNGGVLVPGFQLAYLFRELVAPCLQLLRLGLHGLALRFESFERSGIEREAAAGEALGNAG